MKPGMIGSRLALGLASLAGLAQSFPTAENLAKLARDDGLTPDQLHEKLLNIKEKRLPFDPLENPIQVDGEHEFQPPNFENGDQRGPCPGLNALSNHGYLARHGVVGFVEVIEAISTVYGMGVDLATILSVMGTVGVGNPLSLKPGFSIGGPSKKSHNILGNLLGLLGTPRGLEGSHNWIEADGSNTRDDLYVTGDAATMNMDLFMDAHAEIEKKGAISMSDIGDRAAKRFDDSVASNPLFYYGPYTGFIVRNAGYAFSGRLLSNHSKENPRGGYLTKEVFESFWGVTKDDDGKLKYNKGWERIPENWYRIAGDYGLANLNVDIVTWASAHPKLASIGGNMGEVNTFGGVDLKNITGGAINALTLLEDNNLICFTLEIVKSFAPNSLSGLFKTLKEPLKLVTDAVLDPLLSLDCPAFEELEKGGEDLLANLLERFPGAKEGGFAL